MRTRSPWTIFFLSQLVVVGMAWLPFLPSVMMEDGILSFLDNHEMLFLLALLFLFSLPSLGGLVFLQLSFWEASRMRMGEDRLMKELVPTGGKAFLVWEALAILYSLVVDSGVGSSAISYAMILWCPQAAIWSAGTMALLRIGPFRAGTVSSVRPPLRLEEARSIPISGGVLLRAPRSQPRCTP